LALNRDESISSVQGRFILQGNRQHLSDPLCQACEFLVIALLYWRQQQRLTTLMNRELCDE
jgi:hypothetical protein